MMRVAIVHDTSTGTTEAAAEQMGEVTRRRGPTLIGPLGNSPTGAPSNAHGRSYSE